MTRKRPSFSAAEKAAAVRKHLVENIPVSQIAEQMQVQPMLILGLDQHRHGAGRACFRKPQGCQGRKVQE